MKRQFIVPTEVVLLEALEKLCKSIPERSAQRLTMRLSDSFVSAWLGQAGLHRHVLVEDRICVNATVGDTMARLQAKLRLAA